MEVYIDFMAQNLGCDDEGAVLYVLCGENCPINTERQNLGFSGKFEYFHGKKKTLF